MEFTVVALCTGLVAAGFFGMSKSGVPGIGMLGVIVMAMAFGSQAKLSAGAVVPLLITADILAVSYYIKHCDWGKIRLLAVPVLVGFAIGAVVLHVIDDKMFSRLMGIFVLVMVMIDQLRRFQQRTQRNRPPNPQSSPYLPSSQDSPSRTWYRQTWHLNWDTISHSAMWGYMMGVLGGASTVIANAGGPVMIVYVAALGYGKERMMGTFAVFFFLVNLVKLPIVAGLGLVTQETLLFDVAMLPGVLVGSFIGRRIFLIIPEKGFAVLVTSLNILAAVLLLM